MDDKLNSAERPWVVRQSLWPGGSVVVQQLLKARVSIRAIARHTDNMEDLAEQGAELSDKKSTIYGCYLMVTLLNSLPGLNVVHLHAL